MKQLEFIKRFEDGCEAMSLYKLLYSQLVNHHHHHHLRYFIHRYFKSLWDQSDYDASTCTLQLNKEGRTLVSGGLGLWLSAYGRMMIGFPESGPSLFDITITYPSTQSESAYWTVVNPNDRRWKLFCPY
jgi:hypothetical protein